MDVTQSQMTAFKIISYSGMSRAAVHEAMDSMRQGDFILADKKLQEAEDQMVLAHKAQTKLLQDFANGTEIEVQIIMVHAQDILMTTMTLKEIALEMKEMYKQIRKLDSSMKDNHDG